MARRPDGKLYAVAGASRSGKTLWTGRRVASARRLLVWDLKGEWARDWNCAPVGTLAAFAEACKPGAPPARVAFHVASGMPAYFDPWCRLAWVAIRAHPGGVLVVEETATVTNPGKAPPAWGDICRMALGYGWDVYALTQRPAESDKTALGNATVVHGGRMQTPDDRRTLAKYLDVPLADVAALKPRQFIERHADGRLVRGRV